jgi:hypothetical protein
VIFTSQRKVIDALQNNIILKEGIVVKAVVDIALMVLINKNITTDVKLLLYLF